MSMTSDESSTLKQAAFFLVQTCLFTLLIVLVDHATWFFIGGTAFFAFASAYHFWKWYKHRKNEETL